MLFVQEQYRVVLVLSMALGLCFAGEVKSAEKPRLTPEGEARRESHRFLFEEFAKGKKLIFSGEGENRILNEIVISTERMELSGDAVTIPLPPGSERVAWMFRYLVFRGQGLDNLGGLEMLPYAPKSHMSISTQEPTIYRVKVPSMPVPSPDMPPIVIRTRCKPGTRAVIEEIAFNSQGKLSVVFDDIPYRNLGEEYPPERVPIVIDLSRELSVNGHVDLEREKFCRYYAAPGNLDESFERWALERNFLPGRQIFKFQPTLVEGYSKSQPKLQPRKDIPCAADLSFFEKYESGWNIRRTIPEFRNIKYAMCFNDYPEFMSIKQVGRGTPRVECFDYAAELAAAFVEDEIRDAGRTATWWEVKNESTIKAEWDYHYRRDVDSWALLADFHNRVADAIHRRAPHVKVGGPTSAWMQIQVGDFGLYRNQTRFMDLTKDHLDFYSHHFYEDIGSLGAWERRSRTYTNYLLGRLEAILDMFAAHMHATDNIKPILITECGSLQAGRGPSDYWLRIRSYSAYMHKFMRRPDQIDLAVPFAFLLIPWNPTSGDAAFIPKPGKPNNCKLQDCDPTPVAYLFELWRDFDGRRLPVFHDRQWLDATAVHRGNLVQVVLTNMGGRRLSVDLSSNFKPGDVVSAHQRRLYYWDGKIHYQDSVPVELDHIPVNVEETTIVTIKLRQPLTIRGTLLQRRWYAPETAVKLPARQSRLFEIEVDKRYRMRSAVLLVGLQRDGGYHGSLGVRFNRQRLRVETDWAADFNHLFAQVRIRVPTWLLHERNIIEIYTTEDVTITSVSLETLEVR